MTAPLPFTLHAALPCRPHVGIAASLAAELVGFDEAALERGLAALAPAEVGLAALGEPVRSGALRVRADGDLDDLLIDRVVARGRGDEAVVAIVLSELGRRAGMPMGVVGAGERHYVGHEEVAPWLLDVATGELVDARRLGCEPEWRCGHQVANVLLGAAQERCERSGDLARTLRAATLRCALPFDEDTLEQAVAELRRVRSRLN